MGDTRTVRLENVFLHVTKACNLRCAYCYFSARRPLPDEMTAAELEGLWPGLVAVAPRKVVFTGGEPLLRGDIVELLKSLKAADRNHRVLRCLNTNGHLVTPALAESLVGLADEVRVSLDALRALNDAQRGRGNFEAALRALEIFQEAGFEPKVLVTVTAPALPDLAGLMEMLERRGLTRINLNLFRPIGRGTGHAGWSVDPNRIRGAGRAMPPEPLNCGVGRFLNIMPNGDIYPCHVLTDAGFSLGNVREHSLLRICRRQGYLGSLQRVDFAVLAGQDSQLASLPRECMGTVYEKTKNRPVWSTVVNPTDP